MPAQIQSPLAAQIVDTLKSICDHDINFIDPSGRILASTDPLRVGSFHEAGFHAAESGEIAVIRKDDPSGSVRRGINLPIRYHKETAAVIGITGDPDEVSRYAYLAQRITLLLLREHEIDLKDRNERAQVDYLVRAIINGESIHPDFRQEVLQRNGLSPGNEPWRCAVFRLDRRYNLSNLSMIEAKLFHAFDRMDFSLYTYRYPDEYVLFSDDAGLQKNLYILRELAEEYHELLKIGIGRKVSFPQLHQSYLAAGLAIQSLNAGSNLSVFDDLDLEILLASASENARSVFLEKCLKDLTEEDLSILEIYFSEGQSLKKTADRLYLHVNTLQYRLNRIHERCGFRPQEFRDAVVLYTALKVRKLSR